MRLALTAFFLLALLTAPAAAAPAPGTAPPARTPSTGLPASTASPAPAPSTPIRTLPVTIVVDRAFRDLPRWRGLAAGIIRDAAADLAPSVGLHLEPAGTIDWEPPSGVTRMEDLLSDATRAVGPRPGLTAILLGSRPAGITDATEMGIAFLGRPALLVIAPDQPLKGEALRRHYALFFRHELGHVFGIPHVTGRSVMNASPNRMNAEFGILSLEVLRANRNLDFAAGTPFAGADLTLLRDAYLLLNERGEMETVLLDNLGTALLGAGRAPDAAEVFRAAHARDRHAPAPRLGQARAALALGDTTAAVDLLGALDPSPDWTVDQLGWLGVLWLDTRQYDRACSVLTLALDTAPGRFDFLFNRGLAAFRLHRLDAAAADFRSALSADTERPEAWFNLGLVLHQQGNTHAAAAAFRRYLDMDPDGERSADARAYLDGR